MSVSHGKLKLLVIIVLALLIFSIISQRSTSEAASSPTRISGSFDLSFTNYDSVSKYTIDYQYPSTVNAGQNLTVTVTVFVDELTSLKLFVFDWGIVSTINSPNGEPKSQKLTVAQFNDYLYQGSHWGPVNVTIPVLSSNFTGSNEKSYTTSLTLEWISDVWYDKPYSWHFYESDERDVGNVTITDNAQSSSSSFSSTYYYLLLASGIGIAGAMVFLDSRRDKGSIDHRSRQGD
jgi:hypothetical protein